MRSIYTREVLDIKILNIEGLLTHGVTLPDTVKARAVKKPEEMMRILTYVPVGGYFDGHWADKRAADFAAVTLAALHELYLDANYFIGSTQPQAVPPIEQIELTLAYWSEKGSISKTAKMYSRSTSTVNRVVASVEKALYEILTSFDFNTPLMRWWQLCERHYLQTDKHTFALFRYFHESAQSDVRLRRSLEEERSSGRPRKLDQFETALMMVDKQLRGVNIKKLVSDWEVHPTTYYAARKKYFSGKQSLTAKDLSEVFVSEIDNIQVDAEKNARSWQEEIFNLTHHLICRIIPNITIVENTLMKSKKEMKDPSSEHV